MKNYLILGVIVSLSVLLIFTLKKPNPVTNLNAIMEKDGLKLSWDYDKPSVFKVYKISEENDIEFLGKTSNNYFIDKSPKITKSVYYVIAVDKEKESKKAYIDTFGLFVENYVPKGFKVSYDEPKSSSLGDWVKFEIYTLNKVTPKTKYLTMLINLTPYNKNNTVFESKVILKKDKSRFKDVEKYSAWIFFPKDYYTGNSYDMTYGNFRFLRDDGKYGMLFGQIDPWYFWRIRKSENRDFEKDGLLVKLGDKKYRFATVIRQWEDTPKVIKTIRIKMNPALNSNSGIDIDYNYGGVFYSSEKVRFIYSGGSLYPHKPNVFDFKKVSDNIYVYKIEYHNFASPETEAQIGVVETILPVIRTSEIFTYKFFINGDRYQTVKNLVKELSKDVIELNINLK